MFRNSVISAIVVMAALVMSSNAFSVLKSSSFLRMKSLKMSDADPFAAIKARMASDPNFDPLKDPESMKQLESMVPSEMREFSNAIERLNVSFKDAATGNDDLEALDEVAKIAPQFTSKELLSSPNSAWFKAGAPDETYDENKLKDLLRDVQKEYPEVPMSP